METNSGTPQQQLADVEQARAVAARRLVSQPWYHVALGTMAGSFVAVWALAPDGARGQLAGLFVVALALSEIVYERRTGLRTRALRQPAVLLWSVVIGVLMISGITASLIVTTVGLSRPVEVVSVLAVGLVLAIGSAYSSRRVEQASTADLTRTL